MHNRLLSLPAHSTALPHFQRPRIGLGLIAFGLIALLVLGISIPAAHAQTYAEQTVYNFSTSGKAGDGAEPFADLISIGDTLYGTTNDGGTGNDGTVFAINLKTHTETVLHSFNGTDGSEPRAGLVNVGGTLYGTTSAGGSSNYGTIFAINPDGTGFQTVYNFQGGASDGAYPEADLVSVNGIIYGTAGAGGNNLTNPNSTVGSGTVFSFNPSTHAEITLYRFGPSGSGDGSAPLAGLLAISGTLYGTTSVGGTANVGTIFSIKADGTGYQLLYSFTHSATDGAMPLGGLIDVNGILYGTTSAYVGTFQGTVFSFDPVSHQLTTLYKFTGGDDGGEPFAGLINVNGTLCGTTFSGGIKGFTGTVFAYNVATNTETTLHEFTYSNGDGASPRAGLLNVNGTLYGTTQDNTFSLTPIVAPVAKNDSGRGRFNTPLTIAAPGVLTNDTNNDPNPMTAALVSQPSHGTITFNSDGSFVYTPSTGFVGTDSFTYQAANSVGTSNIATCTLTVQATTPTAGNDSGRTYYNTPMSIQAPGVLGNDSNGGSPTTAALVGNPSHGTLTFHSDGSFTYVPNAGYLGTDSFTYQDTNAIGTSNIATCTLTVQARTPVANNDNGRVQHNTTLTIIAPGVLGNDNPGTTGTITTGLVTGPSHGAITFHSDGSFIYTPTLGFIGTDSFTYQDTNSVGTSNVATCTLTVQ